MSGVSNTLLQVRLRWARGRLQPRIHTQRHQGRGTCACGRPANVCGLNYEPGPYYKYLFSAIGDVWASRASGTDVVTVDAMVCSHPHAGHIQGLTHLLKSKSTKLAFNGPFLVPLDGSAEWVEADQILRQLGFRKVQGWLDSALLWRQVRLSTQRHHRQVY